MNNNIASPSTQLEMINVSSEEFNSIAETQPQKVSCFNSRRVSLCKKICNYLIHAGFILGGVGVILAAISEPLTSSILPDYKSNTSSLECQQEIKHIMTIYDRSITKTTMISGLFSASIPNIILGLKFVAQNYE